MQYFKNSNGINPLFQKLSNQVHNYKETPEGVSIMTDVWEEYADQKVAEQAKEMAISLLKEKVFNNEKIAELTKLPLAEIEALQATI